MVKGDPRKITLFGVEVRGGSDSIESYEYDIQVFDINSLV